MGRLRKTYLLMRRWADRSWIDHGPRPPAILPTFLLCLLALLVPHTPVTTALFGLAAVWFAFVTWRGIRLLRAMAVYGDRQFDRKDKYSLAPEYRRSESTLRAKRRKRPAQT